MTTTAASRDRPLIWWTTSAEINLVLADAAVVASMPPYLLFEARSRAGRNGRGRLWVPLEIDFDGVPGGAFIGSDLDVKPIAAHIERESLGGIVFRRQDWATVAGLPGLVTDENLELVREI
jgi:hypothetical protein